MTGLFRIRIGMAMLLGMLTMPWAAQAASFDCAKAKTQIEKLVCQTPKLSALDDQLASQYSEALKQAKDPIALRKRQRAWLKQLRKYCHTPMCLIGAYMTRIHAIEDGEGAKVYESPSVLSEREESIAAYIKKILTRYPMTLDKDVVKPSKTHFCGNIYSALRDSAPDITYVKPVLQTNDPTSPALGKYNACDFVQLAPVSSQRFTMLDLGETGFRLYRFHASGDPHGKIEEYLYGENPISSSKSSTASLVKVDFHSCNIVDVIPLDSSAPRHNKNPIYGSNILITYRQKYYFLALQRFGNEDPQFMLSLEPFSILKDKFLYQVPCVWSGGQVN